MTPGNGTARLSWKEWRARPGAIYDARACDMKRLPLLVALLWLGCHSPTAPSSLTEGVIVYEHPRFRGAWRQFTGDVRDLDDVSGNACPKDLGSSFVTYDWDDCISSIRVAPGWRVTLYEDPRYEGDAVTLTADESDLENVRRDGDDWDDCISSIRVTSQ